MFLSYNFASDRGVTSLFLFNGVAVDDYFDAGKQKSWRRVFRNLLGLATRMFRVNTAVLWSVTVTI